MNKWIVLSWVVVVLVVCSSVSAIIITPENVTITSFTSSQETVFTVVNDGFSPVRINPVIDPLSLYLDEFVVFSSETDLIKPSEQANLVVFSSFPKNLSPQQHQLIIHPYPGSEEVITLQFRPPGVSRPSLILSNVSLLQDNETDSVSITMSLRNQGNVIVQARPRLFLRQNNTLIKTVNYPQPVLIHPGKVFPLTIRQDTFGLESGNYRVVVDAEFSVDDISGVTNQEVSSFSVFIPEKEASVNSYWWMVIFFVVCVGGALLLVIWYPQSKGLKDKRSQTIYKDIKVLRQEVDSLSREARQLVEQLHRETHG